MDELTEARNAEKYEFAKDVANKLYRQALDNITEFSGKCIGGAALYFPDSADLRVDLIKEELNKLIDSEYTEVALNLYPAWAGQQLFVTFTYRKST